ncbi:hypothetical protein IF1G_09749 [Cordyceps javanica]|uniref:Uncharacterized protein n=1 Tax=Cordyceps javanica TaxID=43265 RepID=A0A545UQE2_9HYPO|nr:hypothetical protein IF1G_09749 [Cordyceps javanica]
MPHPSPFLALVALKVNQQSLIRIAHMSYIAIHIFYQQLYLCICTLIYNGATCSPGLATLDTRGTSSLLSVCQCLGMATSIMARIEADC